MFVALPLPPRLATTCLQSSPRTTSPTWARASSRHAPGGAGGSHPRAFVDDGFAFGVGLFAEVLPLLSRLALQSPQVGAVQRRFATVGLVAGGSGITPMLRLVRAVAAERRAAADSGRAPPCSLALVFANASPEDVPFRAELEVLARSGDLRLSLIVSRGGGQWPHAVGRVNAQLLAAGLPAPTRGALLVLCGPPGLVHDTCVPALRQLGHDVNPARCVTL